VAALNDEIGVLRALADGDHVVRLQEVYEDPDTTFLVLEYIKGDVLIDRLIQKKKYTEFDAKELVRNLLLGVAHIHANRIANRNLTLENLILVSSYLPAIFYSSYIIVPGNSTFATFFPDRFSLPRVSRISRFPTLNLPKRSSFPTHCEPNVERRSLSPPKFWKIAPRMMYLVTCGRSE
jgi:serine/threonine protein kinase